MTDYSSHSKTYTTENAYRSHINSKKHKDTELRAEQAVHAEAQADPVAPIVDLEPSQDILVEKPGATLVIDEDADEDTINQTIDQKIAAARNKLSAGHCLFCPTESPSLETNLTHMASSHSFFVPDAEFLTDIGGLIHYLGEKIAIGNVCIFCNGKGREFRTLDAVRKHMDNKGHCKIAYDTERDRLEMSDYYDFTSSYPIQRMKARKVAQDDEWEDLDEDDEDDGEVDEIVDEDASNSEESDDEELNENGMYLDSPFELVLPSGARLLHKSLHKPYRKALTMVTKQTPLIEEKSGVALVRELLRQKNSALVPRRGGFGAFGQGAEVVKARNHGEAKDAGRHVKEFRDMKRYQDFKTKVGFRHNSQKHFRDPCKPPFPCLSINFNSHNV